MILLIIRRDNLTFIFFLVYIKNLSLFIISKLIDFHIFCFNNIIKRFIILALHYFFDLCSIIFNLCLKILKQPPRIYFLQTECLLYFRLHFSQNCFDAVFFTWRWEWYQQELHHSFKGSIKSFLSWLFFFLFWKDIIVVKYFNYVLI